jgi:hypothetical protein
MWGWGGRSPARGFFVLAFVAVVPGCILGAFQADREDPEDDGEGGGGGEGGAGSVAGSSSETASSASTGGIMPECQLPGDCPQPPSSQCGLATCTDGNCAISPSAYAPAPSQQPNDCNTIYCDGTGGEFYQFEPTDLYDDGNPCTNNVCTGTGPTYPYTAVGKACPTGVCNGGGVCVPTMCPGGNCGPPTACANPVCTDMNCTFQPNPAGTPCTTSSGASSSCDAAGNCIDPP